MFESLTRANNDHVSWDQQDWNYGGPVTFWPYDQNPDRFQVPGDPSDTQLP